MNYKRITLAARTAWLLILVLAGLLTWCTIGVRWTVASVPELTIFEAIVDSAAPAVIDLGQWNAKRGSQNLLGQALDDGGAACLLEIRCGLAGRPDTVKHVVVDATNQAFIWRGLCEQDLVITCQGLELRGLALTVIGDYDSDLLKAHSVNQFAGRLMLWALVVLVPAGVAIAFCVCKRCSTAPREVSG